MFNLLSLGRPNQSLDPSYWGVSHDRISFDACSLSNFDSTPASRPNYLTLSCSLLAAVFILFNLKNLPGVWHIRIVNAFRFICHTQRPSVELAPSHIFQPLITDSTAQLLEIDFNCHKTNSSYFSDVDISRTHLVCTLFAKGIEKKRGGTTAITGTNDPNFGLALGAVSCSFRKEMPPYQQYEMWSKILSWDEKWIYIVTHFVRKGAAKPSSSSLYPQNDRPTSREASTDKFRPEKGLFATALSKCVFKSGRETVSPDTMFKLSGLFQGDGNTSELEHIEAQRVEGLKMVSALATENQRALEAEFGGGDGEALGRHTDGTGLVGVVSTLLQLAGLKRSQWL